MATSLSTSGPSGDSRHGFPHRSTFRASSLLVIVSFLAVYIIWGSTYFAIRVGLESFPPLFLAGVRHLGAGLLLCALFWRNGTRPTRAEWVTAAVTGVLMLFGGNGGVCWA